jgi:hypothetical protein
MVEHKRIRYLIVALTILGVLFMAATLGGALHHHQSSASENACPICHLSHQPIDRPLASDRLPALQPAGPNSEIASYEFAPDPMTRRVPARAPPSL